MDTGKKKNEMRKEKRRNKNNIQLQLKKNYKKRPSNKKKILISDVTVKNIESNIPQDNSKNIITIDEKSIDIKNENLEETSTKIPIKKNANKDNVQSINQNNTLSSKEESNQNDLTNYDEMYDTAIIPKKKLSQKEINRKKYEKSQQKYRSNNRNKRISYNADYNKKNQDNKNTIGRKKDISFKIDNYTKEKEFVPQKSSDNPKEEVKEPKKKDKLSGFIKNVITKYKNNLSNENNFFLEAESRKKKVKKYLKEASIYSLVIMVINILVILLSDNLDTINLFDIDALNITLTALAILVISFIISFLIDIVITEIWIKIKRRKMKKKEEREQNGNQGTK